MTRELCKLRLEARGKRSGVRPFVPRPRTFGSSLKSAKLRATRRRSQFCMQTPLRACGGKLSCSDQSLPK